MVSDTYKPTRKEKQQVQQSYKIKYSLKYRLKTQKDYKSLQKTRVDFTSLKTLPKDSKDHGKQQSSSTSDGLD